MIFFDPKEEDRFRLFREKAKGTCWRFLACPLISVGIAQSQKWKGQFVKISGNMSPKERAGNKA